jgi:hypothetical protein
MMVPLTVVDVVRRQAISFHLAFVAVPLVLELSIAPFNRQYFARRSLALALVLVSMVCFEEQYLSITLWSLLQQRIS